MRGESHKYIPLTELEKAYEVVLRLTDLIAIYQSKIIALRKNQADVAFACTGLEIERINNKVVVVECLHDTFTKKHGLSQINEKSSSDKILFHAAVPTTHELSDKTNLTEEKLKATLKQVALDFEKTFDQGKRISYKTLAIVFLVSDKSISFYFLKNGERTRNIYDLNQKNEVIRCALEGKSAAEIERITGVRQSSIHNYTKNIYQNESNLNTLSAIEIDHNEAIRLIGRAALNRGFLVYSEHIPDFKADIGDHFKYIDLLLLKRDIIYYAVEIEKSNGLYKSISNLMNHFKDVRYKILFVPERILPKAYVIRKEMGITASELKIVKLHEGFEETLMRLFTNHSRSR